ncbi:unnamed protein product [Dicrocoelium dendriticum]|nr:unnamed protein product [Dicrocoelium dendriticum]
MGQRTHALVPTRFLVIMAHLVLCGTLLLDKKSDIIDRSLPKRFSADDARRVYHQCLTAFILSVIFLLLELFGFLSGATMFMGTYNLVSVLFHFSGVVATSYFIVERWNIFSYWYIFVGSICIPFVLEIVNITVRIWFRHSL